MCVHVGVYVCVHTCECACLHAYVQENCRTLHVSGMNAYEIKSSLVPICNGLRVCMRDSLYVKRAGYFFVDDILSSVSALVSWPGILGTRLHQVKLAETDCWPHPRYLPFMHAQQKMICGSPE